MLWFTAVRWAWLVACASALSKGPNRLAPVAWSSANLERLQRCLDEPVDARHGHAPVAAFDADGTLWAGDAYGSFAAVLVRRGLMDPAAARRIAEGYAASEEHERRGWLFEAIERCQHDCM